MRWIVVAFPTLPLSGDASRNRSTVTTIGEATDRFDQGLATQRVVHVVREFHQGLLRDDIFMLAASIAYAGVMSLFPLFVGVIVHRKHDYAHQSAIRPPDTWERA